MAALLLCGSLCDSTAVVQLSRGDLAGTERQRRWPETPAPATGALRLSKRPHTSRRRAARAAWICTECWGKSERPCHILTFVVVCLIRPHRLPGDPFVHRLLRNGHMDVHQWETLLLLLCPAVHRSSSALFVVPTHVQRLRNTRKHVEGQIKE